MVYNGKKSGKGERAGTIMASSMIATESAAMPTVAPTGKSRSRMGTVEEGRRLLDHATKNSCTEGTLRAYEKV